MQELSCDYTIKGKYKVVEQRGNGTLGTAIYLGKDLEQNTDVIIRILPPAILGDEEMSTRFMQGAELAKKLKHPNILKVLDAGVEKEIEYLVTNYEKGFFLNDYLEHRGRLDENESVRLIKALAQALEYAWNEQQIIHRNVCPDTILVAKGNVPLLTDFDLAKSLVTDNKLTLEGFTIGDPRYMSPEQARGETVDFRSDIYCLGLVFYQVLAGNPPFEDKSRMDILRAQISEKHTSIQNRNKSVTDACSTVLDKMLAKDAKDRYNSWKEVIDDLEAILNQEPPSTLQRVVAKPTASRYKMQAIQMQAVKVPVAAPKEEPAPVKEQPVAPAPTDPAPTTEPSPAAAQTASVPPSGPTNSGKRNMIIGAVILVIMVVVGGILIGTMKQEDKKTVEPKPEPKTVIVAKPDPKPVVIPKPEPKKVVITQPKPKPKPKPEPVKTIVKVADQVKEAKRRKACLNNIKQIGVALQMYANVFEGKFPKPNGAKGLDLLRSGGFLELPQVYICPSTGNVPAGPGKPITEETCDYVYSGGLSEYSDGKTPLLWSKPKNHKDFGIILYVNGDVKEYNQNNWLSKTKVKK